MLTNVNSGLLFSPAVALTPLHKHVLEAIRHIHLVKDDYLVEFRHVWFCVCVCVVCVVVVCCVCLCVMGTMKFVIG